MIRYRALGPFAAVVFALACGSTTASSSLGGGSDASLRSDGPAPTMRPAASAPAATDAAAPCDTVARGGATTHAQIVDVRVGTHDGVDRIVFEFKSEAGPSAVPSFDIAIAQPPFLQDASGLPLAVAGDPVLRITMHGATKLGADGRVVYTGPRDLTPGFPILRQHKEGGDFEAVSTWYAGLNRAACVRAYTMSDPLRLVIDLTAR